MMLVDLHLVLLCVLGTWKTFCCAKVCFGWSWVATFI